MSKKPPKRKSDPAIQKQVEQTKLAQPVWDRASEYHVKCRTLAAAVNRDVVDLIDEWHGRALSYYYQGYPQDRAEYEAWLALQLCYAKP